jgi:poly(A) polymerase
VDNPIDPPPKNEPEDHRGDAGAPVIIPRADHGISRKQISRGTLDVLYRLYDAGYRAYIAGGGVRDLLLGKVPKDFDVATNARPEQVRRLFRNSRLIGRRFRLAHVITRDEVIEVSTFRANIEDEQGKEKFHQKSDDGLILRDNVYGSPEQDAWRRDFTVNGLFYNIDDFSIIDFVGGMADLKAGMIRTIGDPQKRMLEDPVRMIRAVRFASSLGFTIDPQTDRVLREQAGHIVKASPPRMFDEVQKLFFCGHAREVLRQLEFYGLLSHMLPELADSLTESERDRHWLDRVTRQLDTWRAHRVPVTPELLYALLFGLIHEQRIEKLKETGLPAFPAADRAVGEHLRTMADRVLIPKMIGRHIAQIMAVQPHFLAIRSGKAARFMQRPCFHDAYIYFKMRSRFDHRHQDEVHFWDEKVREPT